MSTVAFIISVFLTYMDIRDPVFYTLHFLIVLLANDYQFSIYIKHDTSESNSVGNVFDLGQNTTKSLQNSIRLSTTCMSSRVCKIR